MRNLKKIIASILATSAVAAQLTGFAAIPSDVVGTRYEEPMKILSALNIMIGDESGNFRPDDTIIRSEVTKMAVHALGLENAAEAAKGDVKYPDVDANHWANGYVNIATSQGLVIGDDVGNFRPNDKITYAEAMTIFVRALGYEPVAQTKGGYPEGFIVVAADNDLNKNVTGTTYDEISRGNVAFLNANSLTVNLMEQKGFGNNVTYEVVDKTLLEDKLGVVKAEGQIVAIEHSSLTGSSNLSEGQVKIGDKIFETAYDLDHLFGYNVTYYHKENDDGDDEIILATPVAEKNQSLTITAELFESIVDKSGDKTVEYYKNESDKKTSTATISKDAVVVYNGKSDELSDEILNIKDKAGKITLLDTTKSGKYNVVFVTEYQNMVVEEVTSTGKIVDKYGLPTLKLDEDVNYKLIKDGNKIDVSDLEEYDVLSIAESKDKDLYEIIVTNETVEGKIRQLDDEGVYVNNKLYKVAANYNEELSLGTEGIFYLDVEGKIAASDTTTTLSTNYSYLIRAYAAIDAEEKVTFKMFNKDGSEKTLEATEKVRFNGKGGQLAKDVVAQINDANGNTVKQLITFDVNSDGQIVKINTAVDNTATGAANENVFTKNYVLEDAVYNETLQTLGKIKLDEDTVIFDINEDTKDYAIAKLDMFEDSAKYNAIVFDRAEDFTAKAIIITDSSFQTNADSSIAIVQKVTLAANEEDETVKQVTMLQDGKEISLYAEDDDVILKGNGKEIANGDVIQYKKNATGEIASIRVLFNAENKNTELEDKPAENLEILYGKVIKKFASSINMTVNAGEVKNIQIPKSATIYSVDTTKTKNNIEVAAFGDVQAFDEDENNRIFVRIYKDVVQEVVIIK